MLLHTFSTKRYCQISAAADYGSSTNRRLEHPYQPFFLYFPKQHCFEKFPVCRKELPDSLFLVLGRLTLFYTYVSDVSGGHERDG